MKPITAEPKFSPTLNAALTTFALDPRISEALACKLNVMIGSAEAKGIYYMGWSSTYQAIMWNSGVPLDWYQVCRSLNRNGIDTSNFVTEVREWQEANPPLR